LKQRVDGSDVQVAIHIGEERCAIIAFRDAAVGVDLDVIQDYQDVDCREFAIVIDVDWIRWILPRGISQHQVGGQQRPGLQRLEKQSSPIIPSAPPLQENTSLVTIRFQVRLYGMALPPNKEGLDREFGDVLTGGDDYHAYGCRVQANSGENRNSGCLRQKAVYPGLHLRQT
jgi:hypothetical protein